MKIFEDGRVPVAQPFPHSGSGVSHWTPNLLSLLSSGLSSRVSLFRSRLCAARLPLVNHRAGTSATQGGGIVVKSALGRERERERERIGARAKRL
jgi:hypothetical protein